MFHAYNDGWVALKGLDFSAPNSNVERITVEDWVLWCDRARIFLLGHESRAPFLFEPGEEMRLENVVVEAVRLQGEGQHELIRLKPVVNQYMRNQVPGHIRDIHFRNVTASGKPGF